MSNSQAVKQILLVEDNASYRDLVLAAFEEELIPHNLHIVKSGEEALSWLRQQNQYEQVSRPDLILLDLELPRMHGHELLTIIKSEPQFKLIPVIVFTTSTKQKDILKSYSLKANCYVNKPYDLEEFFTVIKKTLQFWLNFSIMPQQINI
jgi:CheY-like chemotaxis protein